MAELPPDGDRGDKRGNDALPEASGAEQTGGSGPTGGSASACGPGCSCGGPNEFGGWIVRREAKAYRQRGPDATTRQLIDGLAAGGVEGMTVLDIGAGVGAVHLALLAAGAASAVDVDGSPDYVEAAREEAARAGRAGDVRHLLGDFVALAPEIEPADLVALDRVVCCYPDMAALVGLSVARARRRYGLVYPRSDWWVRGLSAIGNAGARLIRRPIRAWIHPTADVDALVRAAGFRLLTQKTGFWWQVVVYERA